MSNILTKIESTADILGGDVFFATEQGYDPEYTDNNDLLPNGMYIRIVGSNNNVAYISAYEIDKALSIITEMSMSKASKADLDELKLNINDKISTTEFNLLKSDVDNKASKVDVDNLIDIFNDKADNSLVDEIITQLNQKASQEFANSMMQQIELKADTLDVENLSTKVNEKASVVTVNKLMDDVKSLQETIKLLTNVESIEAIKSQIALLNREIQRRLTIDDLKDVNSKISYINTTNNELKLRVDAVEANLNKKASTTYVQGQVTELNNAITGLAKKVDSKAEKTDIATKANKSDLDIVTTNVQNINKTLSNLSIEVDDKYKELNASISKKAVKSDVDNKISTINAQLLNTCDKSFVNDELNKINKKITLIETTNAENLNELSDDIENFECEVSNTLTELRANINTHSKQISNQSNQITKLQETSSEHNEKLKQPWVRILSTNEYKKLRPAPENSPYSKNYIYPNVIYLIVDYNKPKSIYIGDILIAKAEQKGSIGFAYNFPIVF